MDLAQVCETIRRARGIVVMTGAGVSADSGIPTFRSPGGLWGRYWPEELATPGAFSRDPRTVWEWYEWRRRTVLECEPNDGHRAIAGLLLSREDATLVTQNVDGLHQRALQHSKEDEDPRKGHAWESGSLPEARESAGRRILELHGNILRMRCSACDHFRGVYEAVDASELGALPRCSGCGALMRPDVVWFGESLDSDVLERSFSAARAAGVCIVAGTSAVVHPAASVPLATLESGGVIIEVNPDSTPLTELSHCSLRGSGSDLLPRILGS